MMREHFCPDHFGEAILNRDKGILCVSQYMHVNTKHGYIILFFQELGKLGTSPNYPKTF